MASVHFYTCFLSPHNLAQVVFLAAFDMGSSDLADLLDKICIGGLKLFDNRVLWYTFKHLNKSFPSSLA